MDRSVAEKIVTQHIPELAKRLGLSYWSISFDFAPIAEDDGDPVYGSCRSLVDYQSATIALNPGEFATEAEILETLRHELFHLVLSPFNLFAEAVSKAFDSDDRAAAVLGRVLTHAKEQAVAGLERMHAGLTAPPEPAPKKKGGR